jgi:hypothetical protein
MFFCECLNLVGEVSANSGMAVRNCLKLSAVPAIGDIDGYEAYEFLKSVNIERVFSSFSQNFCVFL